MAALGQVGELVTTQLRERVDRLISALEDDALDFARVTRLAEEVSAGAGTIGEIYGDVERMLIEALKRDSRSEGAQGSQHEPRSEQGSQEAENGAPVDDVTKEELLERAREFNVQGRSSMSKEELAEAVEAEESLTKEELVDRARDAGIEGRSSMTKEELRKALQNGGA